MGSLTRRATPSQIRSYWQRCRSGTVRSDDMRVWWVIWLRVRPIEEEFLGNFVFALSGWMVKLIVSLWKWMHFIFKIMNFISRSACLFFEGTFKLNLDLKVECRAAVQFIAIYKRNNFDGIINLPSQSGTWNSVACDCVAQLSSL